MTKKLVITLGSIHSHLCDLVAEQNPSSFYWWNIVKPTATGAVARRVMLWMILGEFEIKNGFLCFGRNYR